MAARRACSSSVIRSAASSAPMPASTMAASASDRAWRNSTWCSVLSSSKTSASSSGSAWTAEMISSPSSCEALSTMSAISAGGGRDHPPQRAPAARVDARHLPPAAPRAQLDVAGGDQPPRLHADDPPPEHVAAEQHLTLAAFEAEQAERLTGELHTLALHLADAIAGDEELAPGKPPDQPGHGRVATRAQADDHVLDSPERLPGAVDDPAVGDLGEPEARDPRRRRLSV